MHLIRTPRSLLRQLGPGLITGAADDDPSGIATYSQAGAAFGTALGWSVVLTLPFMIAVQESCARIGRVTGRGLGAVLREHAPRPALIGIVVLLLIANILNIGADIAAMGEATRLILGGPAHVYAVGVALFCVVAEIWISYRRYVVLLKWLTLSLLSYIALLFVVHVPWAQVAWGAFVPQLQLNRDAFAMLVAVLGTTISPYLFFWQADQEAEDEAVSADPRPLRRHPADAPREMRRIGFDTWTGMAFSNIVALAILVGTAVTLHVHGITQIDTAEQAASALKPIAGQFASLIFAIGILGTGLLAVPTLAGSAAYAMGEALDVRVGLRRKARDARTFYTILAAATLIGLAIVFSPLNPIKALIWSAIINGVVAVPVIVALVLMGSSARVMGKLVLPWPLRVLSWCTALLMGVGTIGMIVL